MLVFGAQDSQAPERQIEQEVDEALLQAFKVAVVRRQMIIVDVGDNGHDWLQMDE